MKPSSPEFSGSAPLVPERVDAHIASATFSAEDPSTTFRLDPLARLGLELCSESGLIVWIEGEASSGLHPLVQSGGCFVVRGRACMRSIVLGGEPFLDFFTVQGDQEKHEMRVPAIDVLMVAPMNDADAGREHAQSELATRRARLQ